MHHFDYITGEHLEFTPKVSEGDIIFFPSTIMHECKQVQSDKNVLYFLLISQHDNERTNTSRVATHATTSNAK